MGLGICTVTRCVEIKKSKRPLKKESKDLTSVNVETEHIQGSIDSPISLIEYGDYECPYTGMAYPIVKEIMKRFKNKIYFEFRTFPLNDIHPHAQHAAEAAEAAAAQDKFWQMHDYLFEHQKALDDSHLLQYAKKVRLDLNRFKKEMTGHVYAPLIEKSLKSGTDHGVEGTPTFFVNGKHYEDSWDLETFSDFLSTINP